MPVGIVEVDDVDRPDARFVEHHVVVVHRRADLLHEELAVAQLLGHVPHPSHDLGRQRQAVLLLGEARVALSDHVEEDPEQRAIVGVGGGEVARAEEHVLDLRRVGLRIVPPVLAVGQQDVDADRRRRPRELVGQREEDGHAGSAVVGARQGIDPRERIAGPLGHRARVPVRRQQDPLAGGGLEARPHVRQRQRVAVRGHVCERDLRYRVGALPQIRRHPLQRGRVRLAPRHPRPERHLPRDQTVRQRPVERPPPRRLPLPAPDRNHEADGEKREAASGAGSRTRSAKQIAQLQG